VVQASTAEVARVLLGDPAFCEKILDRWNLDSARLPPMGVWCYYAATLCGPKPSTPAEWMRQIPRVLHFEGVARGGFCCHACLMADGGGRTTEVAELDVRGALQCKACERAETRGAVAGLAILVQKRIPWDVRNLILGALLDGGGGRRAVQGGGVAGPFFTSSQ
jgi:hypothetical protein